MSWGVADIPPQEGRVAIVTGANSGIGFHTALELARAGAEVIVACRSETRGVDAVSRIQAQYSGAKAIFEPLDLASLASIAAFATRMKSRTRTLDLLINNAGLALLPRRQITADGFEMQFGVNFLGHFALTARLLPLLRAAEKPRVVNVSSIAHKGGAIHLDDLQWEKAYKPWPAYQQSKLAMLMFSIALQRRSDLEHWGIMANAAHPGYARTALLDNGPGGIMAKLSSMLSGPVSQTSAAGALPTLFAATSPAAQPGGYYGPQGLFELKGPPVPVKIAPQAKDQAVLNKLWDAAETLTGTSFKPAP